MIAARLDSTRVVSGRSNTEPRFRGETGALFFSVTKKSGSAIGRGREKKRLPCAPFRTATLLQFFTRRSNGSTSTVPDVKYNHRRLPNREQDPVNLSPLD